MAVAVGRAAERGAPGVICASTGNTAASAAAYAARAGLPALILSRRAPSPREARPGASRPGPSSARSTAPSTTRTLLARRLAAEEGWVNVNSINPDRIEGQASAAREIVEQLGGPPDVLALPYGGGGNTTAYLRGFERRRASRGSSRCSPASARRPSAPRSGSSSRSTASRSRPRAEIVTVTDAELLEWWPAIPRLEGLFCEPASAAGVAGVAQVRPRAAALSASSPATG